MRLQLTAILLSLALGGCTGPVEVAPKTSNSVSPSALTPPIFADWCPIDAANQTVAVDTGGLGEAGISPEYPSKYGSAFCKAWIVDFTPAQPGNFTSEVVMFGSPQNSADLTAANCASAHYAVTIYGYDADGNAASESSMTRSSIALPPTAPSGRPRLRHAALASPRSG
jgi:hypothetical protein